MTAKAEAKVIEVSGREVALAPSGPTGMAALIAKADKLDIEKIKELRAMQREWETDEARKAFDAALSDAKAEIPVITKNRHVGFASKKQGAASTSYRHEDLGEIAKTIDPILGKYGLSYRFRIKTAINEPIVVTCIISHRLGHSEENEMSAGRDDSGNKNSIQAIGSTVTYLQRYLLKASLGLAASNDDDGQRADETVADGPINEKQLRMIQKAIVRTGSQIHLFCKAMRIESVPELPTSRFDEAMKRFREIAAKHNVDLGENEPDDEEGGQ